MRSREEIAEITGDGALGETRYNAEGSIDLMKWARPQSDGLALRALAVMRFFALDGFRARAGEAASTLLRYDLDYTLSHWRLPCYDLWEESLSFHYHTRLVQQAALVVQAGRRAGPHSVVDPRMLATSAALERLFEQDYPINRTRSADCAPALGRYAGDSYFTGGAYFFSTLGAEQYCFLLAQAAAEGEEVVVAEESRGPLAELLRTSAEALPEGALASPLRDRLAEAALRRGDMYLAMARRHTPASREMAEQFSRYDGAPTSSRNLSWSYACFILAVAARRRAAHAMGERRVG